MKSSEIRKEARESLSGKWGKAACITLTFLVISFAVGFLQGLVGEESAFYDLIDLAYGIISIPISFGLLISFIKLKKGENVKPFDFFKEGFSRFGKSYGIWFHTLIKLLLPTILFIVLLVALVFLIIAAAVEETFSTTLLIVVILLLATTIYMMIKSLLYVFAYNISYDNPELSSKECVLKSAELMKGNRGKYFLLELSFIGWTILAGFTLGIGMLWLMPYMQIAAICFYEKLSNPEAEKAEEVINTKE